MGNGCTLRLYLLLTVLFLFLSSRFLIFFSRWNIWNCTQALKLDALTQRKKYLCPWTSPKAFVSPMKDDMVVVVDPRTLTHLTMNTR